MWHLTQIDCPHTCWFSDGQPVHDMRGGNGVSSRLIIDRQGFLDLTEIEVPHMLDANGEVLWFVPEPETSSHQKRNENDPPPWMDLYLVVKDDGSFELSWPNCTTDMGFYSRTPRVSGKLKPLPSVSLEDANFIDTMITDRYVPYPNIPDAPGKTLEEIKALGERLFPFTPHSFQLAMCVYDWTTASFTRLVFFKIFQYTGLPPPPFPLDRNSIAEQIWTSNWGSYNPKDADFMRSFMMKPADSLDDIKAQLSNVAAAIHNFSEVENRLLSAAMQALPRTSIFQHSQLFSGQVDIYQLGLDHFGIEFLQCPLNSDPDEKALITPLADARADYVSEGKTITTKMVWSFTDSIQDAMHYSNGILLVANISDSAVWERAAYVTPLSDDPAKTEYTFMPETVFEVQSVDTATVGDKQVVVITLQPQPEDKQASVARQLPKEARESLQPRLEGHEVRASLAPSDTSAVRLPHSPNKTGGRRCACLEGTMPSPSTVAPWREVLPKDIHKTHANT